MTAEQFQQLLATIGGNVGGGGGQAAGAAAVMGPMQHCHLGKDKIKRYKRWVNWIQDAENKMTFLRLNTDKEKIGFMQRMSLIAGMKDRTLAEKAIVEEYTLMQVIQAGVNRETSKANMEERWRRSYTKEEI